MKNLTAIGLTLAILFTLSGASYGVSAQFQVGVTIVAPPIMMNSENFPPVLTAVTPVQPDYGTENYSAPEYVWEVQKSNITDGILLTYLMK